MSTDWRMNTEDRAAQVNWIDELAGNLASMGRINDPAATAEEIVEYALSKEGLKSWDINLPAWFDDHDRRLLTERVSEP